MDTLMNSLLGIVENLLIENRALYKASEIHKKALVAGDVDGIDSAVQIMSKHIERISELETQRQKMSLLLAKRYQVSTEEVTVSFLLERIDNKSAVKLQALTNELQTIVVKLAESNEQNRLLLQSSLSYLNKTVQLVASVTSQDSYGPKKSTQVGVRLFNVQA